MNLPFPLQALCIILYILHKTAAHLCVHSQGSSHRGCSSDLCDHCLTPVRCWSFWCKLFMCFLPQHSPTFGSNFVFFVIQVFKRHNPSTAEEQEMMENLFDSLCSCLMLSSNRDRFLKGEGLQLMNLMLRYLITIVISFLFWCANVFWLDTCGFILKLLC